jgi:hypothetical protein
MHAQVPLQARAQAHMHHVNCIQTGKCAGAHAVQFRWGTWVSHHRNLKSPLGPLLARQRQGLGTQVSPWEAGACVESRGRAKNNQEQGEGYNACEVCVLEGQRSLVAGRKVEQNSVHSQGAIGQQFNNKKGAPPKQ